MDPPNFGIFERRNDEYVLIDPSNHRNTNEFIEQQKGQCKQRIKTLSSIKKFCHFVAKSIGKDIKKKVEIEIHTKAAKNLRYQMRSKFNINMTKRQ